MRALGEFAVRRRRWILMATLVLAVVAGAFGGNVAQHLSSGGFDDPSSESSRMVTGYGPAFCNCGLPLSLRDTVTCSTAWRLSQSDS